MKPLVAALLHPKPLVRGALALAALALGLAATEAAASTAANTTITNTATVSYNDAGGLAQTPVTASASVTVTLVPSAVVLSSPPDQTIAQGTSATLTYTITATANGPDTYDLSSVATPANLSAVVVTLPASIDLGGSTLAADATDGATSVTVPYDGTADGVVNGIAVGDTIVFGGNAYTVTGVTENPGANTTAVDLGSAVSGGTVAAGQIVGESATFTATVPSGTVVSGGSGTQTVSTTATSQADAAATTTQATPTVITVNRPTLTVTKTVSTDGGATFAATGVAPPGTTLIYRVVATNTGATDATSVAFADAIPAYLTYVTDSGRYATSSATAYGSATALTDAADGDGYAFAAGAISFDPGGATGTVAGGGELVLFYQATIN
jgi:uncharacterized repeat protein (TIGR01451 family)